MDVLSRFGGGGRRAALAVVRGELDVATALADTQQATRNYAKRQVTWFRQETGIEIWTSNSNRL
jgi:tRNA A37 N6-isopentenylltransferase MiaA